MSKAPRPSQSMTPIRDVFASFWSACRSPRICVLLWVIVTAIALPLALQARAVADQDAARWPAPFVLPADGDVFAALRLDLAIPLLLALLVGIFSAGAVINAVGLPGPRRPLRELLTAGTAGFLANARVVLVFAVLALLVGWGLDVLDDLVRGRWLRDRDPGGVAVGLKLFDLRWWHLLAFWDFARGAVFLALLFVSKIAMVRLARAGRSSALVAATSAIGCALRHPLRIALVVALWVVVWIGGSFAFGELTVRLLEVRGNLLLGAVAGQLGVLFAIVGWVGFILSARRVGEPKASAVTAGVSGLDIFAE